MQQKEKKNLKKAQTSLYVHPFHFTVPTAYGMEFIFEKKKIKERRKAKSYL